ncbi:MAG TPA: sialate O-acetylesterase [Tepidisphaeraceae bacterium]|nr:sialate O-acetylesterase [Tepidisphaeraceae bacterium]
MTAKPNAILLLVITAVTIVVSGARADVALPNLFSDHMVLQREATIPVWGTADAGEQVAVTIANQSRLTVADAKGRWRVDFDPIHSERPLVLTVKGKTTLTVNDIRMGEVWVCSGQSNMEWPISRSLNAEAEAAGANWPDIRFFNVSPKKKPAREPARDVDAQWTICTPESANGFSAVGYFFGRHLHQKLDGVPIGLINVSWGGMPAEAFTDMETLRSDPAFNDILTRFNNAVTIYPQALAAYEEKLAEWERAKKEAEAKGEKVPNRPGAPYGPDSPNGPAALWNGMVHPITPFAIRGAIWYQGESNAGDPLRAAQYRKLLPAMITGWRRAWGQGDFPFLIVQLANYRAPASQPAEPESAWALLREAQTLTAAEMKRVGQAVTIDIGEANDIHPKNKQDVGLRLGLAAEKIAYGRDVIFSGPALDSMKVDGDAAVLTFQHIGSGLMSKTERLEGFAIRGEDGVWHPGEATIDGETVIVRSEHVAKPHAIRYAWANNPPASLYNNEGLPAVPFRTDGE